MVHQKH